MLELPFRTIFWRRLTRSLKRAWTHEIVCGGNTETFWQHFFTRESAILEVIQKRWRYATVFDRTIGEAPAGINFYRIRSANELDEFYRLHVLVRDTCPTALHQLGDYLAANVARLKLRKPFRNVVQSDHLLDHRINLLFCHQTDHLFSHKCQVDLRLSIS